MSTTTAAKNIKKQPAQKKLTKSKRLNHVLKNGWCILTAKIIPGRQIVQLSATNFNDCVKLFLDAENKVLLNDEYFKIEKDEAETIIKLITG